jgi:hypothetical protein
MRECIEEGILQAYVDNELSPEMAESVVSHLKVCPVCAAAASEAQSETTLFTSAFEAESLLHVPTLRLRERLDAAIADLERPAGALNQKQGRGLGGWLASFAGLFKVAPERALGFASLIAVVALAAIFAVVWSKRTERNESAPAVVADSGKREKTGPGSDVRPSPSPVAPSSPNSDSEKDEKNAPGKRQKPKKPATPNLVPEPDQLPKDELAATPLPGEENYLKAINAMMREIETSDETALKPSLRAEYERNLAIVDQAITSTRRVARRNPNDADAAEFLYSSYQSKLDLLSTVANQVRPIIATR